MPRALVTLLESSRVKGAGCVGFWDFSRGLWVQDLGPKFKGLAAKG